MLVPLPLIPAGTLDQFAVPPPRLLPLVRFKKKRERNVPKKKLNHSSIRQILDNLLIWLVQAKIHTYKKPQLHILLKTVGGMFLLTMLTTEQTI